MSTVDEPESAVLVPNRAFPSQSKYPLLNVAKANKSAELNSEDLCLNILFDLDQGQAGCDSEPAKGELENACAVCNSTCSDYRRERSRSWPEGIQYPKNCIPVGSGVSGTSDRDDEGPREGNVSRREASSPSTGCKTSHTTPSAPTSLSTATSTRPIFSKFRKENLHPGEQNLPNFEECDQNCEPIGPKPFYSQLAVAQILVSNFDRSFLKFQPFSYPIQNCLAVGKVPKTNKENLDPGIFECCKIFWILNFRRA